MAECRKVQVVLLDDRRLTFNVQTKMYTYDLFDIVSTHFSLKEKEYFGLFYLDETNNQQWLQTDRKVLDHDLPKKTEAVMLYFAVRFYIENMCYLQDSVSVELYYMQARQSVYRGALECDSNQVFDLAAYALQIAQGNLASDEQAREALKKLSVFPSSTLREHASMQYCEDQVLLRYYGMRGLSRGQAMISYMSVVEKLPTYGIHYYEVKNKQGTPWWLGLSFKGIAQYDFSSKSAPRKVFPWKYLENLYFRDKKFSIEVHDPKRVVHTLSSFNLYEDAIREPVDECDDLSDAISDPTTQVSVSKRTFGPSNVNVHAWFTSKPQLTKSIWSMAVCQHQFFLDRLQNKSTLMVKRCPNVIADELNLPRTQSMHTMNRINSHVSLQESALTSLNMHSSKKLQQPTLAKPELSAEEKAKQLEVYRGLQERKKSLDAVLQDKIKELKALCLKESEITGELPHEYTSFMSPGEKTPVVKRRMGTAFSIAELVANKDSDLTKLEMEYEVQKQILKAKQKLANDDTLSKNVRKKHTADYSDARNKLKELEKRLKSVRAQAGLDSGSFTSEDNTSLGSMGSSSAIVRSPKKSISSQQLESLEYSPGTRRRMNSGSRMLNSHKVNNTRGFEIASNPSSTSSLASLTHLEGYSDFTPTKALKYNRPQGGVPAPYLPVVHSAADLNSVGSSNAHSSSSSLHAYSVSGGRPLRSGSMDDVRLAGSANGTDVSSVQGGHGHTPDRSTQNGAGPRTKSYLTNNPYGSLERKTLKQRRAMSSRGASEGPPVPSPQMYNPYMPRANYAYSDAMPSRRAPPPLPHSDEPPPIPGARVPSQQPSIRAGPAPAPHHHHRMDRDYAHSVQLTSRRMYDSSQPFQMLENPYGSQQRQPAQPFPNAHIEPIEIETSSQIPAPLPPRRTNSEHGHTDSSTPSSPQENAFKFFNTLAQMQSVANNNNAYNKQESTGSAAEESSSQRSSYSQEESKPYVMQDYYQYSERLRKARGIHGASPKPPDLPPQPTPRSSGNRPSSQMSMQGSRSGSPYMPGSGYNRSSSSSPHGYASSLPVQQGYNNARPSQSRRSTGKDCSFNTGDVADNFSQEMLAWYQDQDDQTSSTLV